jgi:glyoxylase I family protein
MCYPEAKPQPREPGERLGWRMMALEVEDMDRALAHLKGKGIEPSWGPKKRPTYARAEIRDPDGNSIELRQWIGQGS